MRIPALAVALCCCSVVLARQPDRPPARPAGSFESTTRTVQLANGRSVEVQTGTLVVPESRGKPGSRLIKLAFARLKGPASGTRPPVLYLPGGPGSAVVSTVDDPRAIARWASLLAVTDVLFLDQRGTGRSEPDLLVPYDEPLPETVFSDAKAGVEHARRSAAEAFRKLTDRGVDLYAYNTEASADDIEELRNALGEPKLSLVGFSYGTHLALSTVRRHGEHLENVVLVGTEGPGHTLKLPDTYTAQIDRLSALAAADPNVNAQVPDLKALLVRVLARLEREPLMVPIDDAGASRLLPVGAIGLRYILRLDIGDSNDFVVFPRLLHSIDRGDPSILSWFVSKRYPQMTRGNSAMFWMTDLSSWADPDRIALIDAQTPGCVLGPVVNPLMRETWEAWGSPDLGPAFRAPIRTDVRTLAFSGTLDSNTPPNQTEQTLAEFTRATHIVVENAGHEDMLFVNRDVGMTILRFLRGEDVNGTRIALPAPRFVPIEGDDPQPTHPSLQGR